MALCAEVQAVTAERQGAGSEGQRGVGGDYGAVCEGWRGVRGR